MPGTVVGTGDAKTKKTSPSDSCIVHVEGTLAGIQGCAYTRKLEEYTDHYKYEKKHKHCWAGEGARGGFRALGELSSL